MVSRSARSGARRVHFFRSTALLAGRTLPKLKDVAFRIMTVEDGSTLKLPRPLGGIHLTTQLGNLGCGGFNAADNEDQLDWRVLATDWRRLNLNGCRNVRRNGDHYQLEAIGLQDHVT